MISQYSCSLFSSKQGGESERDMRTPVLVFIPLNWELAFSGMVCADAAFCIVLAGVRASLQKDGMLSVREGVSERTQTPAKSEPARPLVSAPAPACRSARGNASSLKTSVLLRNKSYMIHARAVSPEEGNSLRRECGGDGRSCLSTSTVDAASGVSAMVGGQSEGFVHVVFIQQVWP